MPFTFGGFPVYSPGQALRNASDAQWAAPMLLGEWAKSANHFRCPLGFRPGTGVLLMRRGDIDQLKLGRSQSKDGYVMGSGTQDDYIPLRIFGHQDDDDKTINKIAVCGFIECISPGARAEPDSIYAVPIADRRWYLWNRGEPIKKAYNCRDCDGKYITATLNHGSPYTWQQMVADIWLDTNSSAGPCPDLPFTPDGTPEGFFYVNEHRFMALQHIFDRLACSLKLDPFDDVFTFVRLGDDTTDSEKTWRHTVIPGYADRRIWDDNAKRTFSVVRPDNVRVKFRVRPTYDDESVPWYTKDIPVSPSTGPLGVGTFITLEDDLYALSVNGTTTIRNDASLAARALERAGDVIRVKDKTDRDDYRRYAGPIIDDAIDALGSTVTGICWEDRQSHPDRPGGMETSFFSGGNVADATENWRRPDYKDEDCCCGTGGTGGGGGIGGGGGGGGDCNDGGPSCRGHWGAPYCGQGPPGWIWVQGDCSNPMGMWFDHSVNSWVPGPGPCGGYVTVPCGTPAPPGAPCVMAPPPTPPSFQNVLCNGGSGGGAGGGGTAGGGGSGGGGAGGGTGGGKIINGVICPGTWVCDGTGNPATGGCWCDKGGMGDGLKSAGGCSGDCGCGGTCGGGANLRPVSAPGETPSVAGVDGHTVGLIIAYATEIAAAAVAAAGAMTVVAKTTDETRASTTTLANDAKLILALEANKTYAIRLKVFFDDGDVGGADGFKYAIIGPAGSTAVRVKRQHYGPGNLASSGFQTDTTYTASTSITCAADKGGWVEMDLIVQNGATAGTFAFQWAQNTSTAVNTKVLAGSYLTYRKVN